MSPLFGYNVIKDWNTQRDSGYNLIMTISRASIRDMIV
jgi:hypothetical protein